MSEEQPPDYLTPRQVATRSHFSYATVMRAIRCGRLRANKISASGAGTGGQWRVETGAYRDWMKGVGRPTDTTRRAG